MFKPPYPAPIPLSPANIERQTVFNIMKKELEAEITSDVDFKARMAKLEYLFNVLKEGKKE